MRAIASLALVAAGFAAGLGVGVLVWRESRRPEAARPDEVARASAPAVPDPAAPSPSPIAQVPSPPSPRPDGPTLEAHPPVPGADTRRRVAAAARAELGENLPADALEDAARRSSEAIENAPTAYARAAVVRERARRVLGELSDPWEIVVQVRTASSFAFDVSDLLGERPRVVPASAPIDVTRPVVAASAREPVVVWMRGGVVPPRIDAVVLETVEVEGEFGTEGGREGSVEVYFDGFRPPEVCGRGTTKARLAGSHLAWRWSGHDGGDLRIDVRSAAVEVRLKGRFQDPDAPRPPERAFRVLEAGSDGWITGGPVVLQVVADHGGGNPRALSFEGVRNMYLDEISTRPVWDEAVDLRTLRRATAFASGAGWIPPGKAFRVRRVDWRVRLAEPYDHGRLTIQLAGRPVVRCPAEAQTPEEHAAQREESRRLRREREEAERRGQSLPAAFFSGTWTGDFLVRPGEESRTSLTCAYFAMGEAVLHGDLVDDGK